MSDTKLPLDLSVEVETASGAHYVWSSQAKDPRNIPQNISCSSSRGNGFADATVTVSRRIDQDYVDINLFDTVRFIGADGSIAYEGRVAAEPRSLDATHQIQLTLVGWMAHAKDRPFTEIYVDRDLTKWQGPSVQRQINFTNIGIDVEQPGGVQTDATTGFPALTTQMTGAWARQHVCEAMYDAKGVSIGSVYYAWKLNPIINAADANWGWSVTLGTNDVYITANATGSLRAAGPGTGTLAAPDATRHFAMVQQLYAVAAGGASELYSLYWTCLAVYGNHGLTKQGTANTQNAQGFYASDVIKNIASRFAPQLSTAGAQATTFAIPQLAFTDPTLPFDAFTSINAYHIWDLAVWENKTLYYQPTDTSDYDWQVRLSDIGVTVALQGDSTDNLANGIVVSYQDVTDGHTKTITPTDNAALLDSNPNNPATVHGLQKWTTLNLTFPTTTAGAVQIGSAALSQFNQVRSPGAINVAGGYIRDRAGHWQPGWKVRSSDTIAIVDHPNSNPRLITEANWDQPSHSLKVTVDNSLSSLEAIFARIMNAYGAASLSASAPSI